MNGIQRDVLSWAAHFISAVILLDPKTAQLWHWILQGPMIPLEATKLLKAITNIIVFML